MDFDEARQRVTDYMRAGRGDPDLVFGTQPSGSEDDTHFSVWETPPPNGIVHVGTPVWFVEKLTGTVSYNNPMYCRERLAAMTPVGIELPD
ncbi:MAG: hypothetical protein WBF79_14885 [Rhodococcus sp. (in: high G+C Gram-positive bacteria)]